MSDRNDMLVKVALLYYEDQITQTDIAKKLGISRPTVAAMLQEAKAKGIVKITIQHTEYRLVQLQKQLRQKYNLKNVLITPSEKEQKREVGRLCAELTEPLLANAKKLGIGWGTTVYEYVNQAGFSNINALKVVPLIGGVGLSDFKYHSNHLAFLLAQKYGCEMSYFYAPAIAESAQMKQTFMESVLVKDILEEAKTVDVAVIGVGNPIRSSTYRELGYINNDDIKELLKNDAIGDIGAVFFNQNGDRVDTDISNRMIGIDMNDLISIPDVVVLATGKEKTDSIKILLQKKLINHLVIDQEIAMEL